LISPPNFKLEALTCFVVDNLDILATKGVELSFNKNIGQTFDYHSAVKSASVL